MRKRAGRYLIVNADDFGITLGVSRGILEAHLRGILTSVSLMTDRPASRSAAALAQLIPSLSVGLHLELNNADIAEPRTWMRDQLDAFVRLMGRPPTHVDSHHDVHRDPRVLPYVLEAARPLNIPVRGYSHVHCLTKFYGQWGGETHCEQVSVESLIGMLETEVGCGVTELICHPGYADAELDSSYASVREAEIRTLCDPRVRDALRRAGIELAGFGALATMPTGDTQLNPRPSCQA